MAAGPQDAPRHAGQVVRRVLLRRNIAIDPRSHRGAEGRAYESSGWDTGYLES